MATDHENTSDRAAWLSLWADRNASIVLKSREPAVPLVIPPEFVAVIGEATASPRLRWGPQTAQRALLVCLEQAGRPLNIREIYARTEFAINGGGPVLHGAIRTLLNQGRITSREGPGGPHVFAIRKGGR